MFSKALVISSLFSVAFATVFITSPTGTSVFSGGKAGAVVAWQDDGNAPTLPLFGAAMISIYVGNAIQQTNVQIISNSTDVSKISTVTFTPDPTIGPNGNEYFIRIESLAGTNASIPYESFSAKFTLNNMSGNFSSSVQAEIAGQSTAPLAPLPSLSQTSPSSSTPSLTSSSASKNPTSTSSTASSTATGGALGLKAGWGSIVFGVVVGVTMF